MGLWMVKHGRGISARSSRLDDSGKLHWTCISLSYNHTSDAMSVPPWPFGPGTLEVHLLFVLLWRQRQ